jgi:hypothetical protein
MSLDELARDAGAEVRDQAAAIEPPEAGAIARRSRRGRMATGVAAIAVLALAGVGLAVALHDDPEPSRLQITDDPGLPGVLPANGWVAFTSGSGVNGWPGDDVYLVREGEPPRRVAGDDADASDQVCPAFSPDGGRLVFGQATFASRYGGDHEDDAELVIIEVGADGSTSGRTTIPVDDLREPPCPLWSPDGRWLAFGVESEVRLVDTVTEEQRRLAGYAATDLEWLPGTDELAIADHGIDVYSVTTGAVRSLGIDGVETLTWSPDGSTVAFTRASSVDDSRTSLWLADADGSDERQLTRERTVLIGIGPVWSPDGRTIAYQRSITLGESSAAVLVTATGDADNPIGTETVINPRGNSGMLAQTPGPDGPVAWYPESVSWSPDGSMLLYIATNDACRSRSSPACVAQGGFSLDGVLAVPVDPTRAPSVLVAPSYEDPSFNASRGGPQAWGRQPPD